MDIHNLVNNLLNPATRTKASAAGPVIAWSGVGQQKRTPRHYAQLAEDRFRKNVSPIVA